MVYKERRVVQKAFFVNEREHGSQRQEEFIYVGLINTQGLTKHKSVELERVIKEENLNLLCITETQTNRFHRFCGRILSDERRERQKRRRVNGSC